MPDSSRPLSALASGRRDLLRLGAGASPRPWRRKLRLFGIVAVLAAIAAFESGRPVASMADAAYQRVEPWAQLPPGTSWGVMSAVAIDAGGRIYGFQRDEPSSKVLVFEADGRYLKTWGENTFAYPHGMRVLRDGHVWATDRKMQQVLEFDLDGRLLMSLGRKNVAGDNESRDAFNGASDVAMSENGDLFVSDGEGENTRVVKFSGDGRFLKAWGRRGSAAGELNTPHCIGIDNSGRVWVCDRGNKRLQVFDQEGNYLDQMTQFGTPVSVAFGTGDEIYVATGAPENSVTVGTTDGKVTASIDGLDSPHGIAVDASGAIYVAQSAGKAIVKFVRN